MFLAILLHVCLNAAHASTDFPVPPKSSTVLKNYDGDTITLANNDKVRLRWVNTPELKPAEAYGIEAREAARTFLAGKEVTLVMASENPRDGYGRLLAGLVTDEGDLSVHLLELGLGHVFIIPPDDTDLSAMLSAQARARNARRGIWSNPRYQGKLHITSFHANAKGDDRSNVNGEYLRICNITNEPINIDGFRIEDVNSNSWTLPALTIPAGHTIKLHSGVGEHQTDTTKQLEVFLGSSVPIWNNKYDKATILDRFGKTEDQREHSVQEARP